MQTKMVRGVEIDICPECGSAWLDSGELQSITDLEIDVSRVLECPTCDEQLQTKILKGVEVDVCPRCSGVYLDRGEIERLSAFEHSIGEKTEIGKFLNDANDLRIDLAVRLYMKGVYDKGKAAEIAGITIELFEDLLKEIE